MTLLQGRLGILCKLRVLWFTDVRPPAIRRRLGEALSIGPASWVESLREAVSGSSRVSLAIASASANAIDPFVEDDCLYLTLSTNPRPQGRARRIADAWRCQPLFQGDLREALRLVDSLKPHVVHVHGTEGPFGLMAPLSRAPVVVSLQGLPTVYERFFFHGMSATDVAHLVPTRAFVRGGSELHNFVRMHRTGERERRILRGGSLFIGRTEWDRSVLQAYNPRARYFHCDEVMRKPFYGGQWHPVGRDCPVIFSTSSAMLFKGTECLLEAVGLLRTGGASQLRVRIAGVPDGGDVARFYRRRAAQLGVEPLVEWLGRLDAQQLVRELEGADLFVYPSHIDNSPNSLSEAMLVGVPCVASYVGGIPSLLKNGEEGLLFADGDPYALAGRIKLLLEDPQLALRLGRKARVTAQSRHSPHRITERLMTIYGEIAGSA